MLTLSWLFKGLTRKHPIIFDTPSAIFINVIADVGKMNEIDGSYISMITIIRIRKYIYGNTNHALSSVRTGKK